MKFSEKVLLICIECEKTYLDAKKLCYLEKNKSFWFVLGSNFQLSFWLGVFKLSSQTQCLKLFIDIKNHIYLILV